MPAVRASPPGPCDAGAVSNRRDDDILATPPRAASPPVVDAVPGLVVEVRADGFCGDVVAATGAGVTLRDRKGRERNFAWQPAAFMVDGVVVTLRRPVAAGERAPRRSSAGGVLADGPRRARIASPHRIWVEGIHDAELVEHVWGDELREVGVVVEPLHGADDLELAVAAFDPNPERRLGVLLDHLVEGSKESRIAAGIRRRDVLVTGHPFVDVWAGVRPRVLGLDAWPDVPRGVPFKQGLCDAVGLPLEGFWPRLRSSVGSFADLEPELVGAVERLIDFVAPPG